MVFPVTHLSAEASHSQQLKQPVLLPRLLRCSGASQPLLPWYSAHPTPRFIWGKKPSARDPALPFLHCLTPCRADPSLALAVSLMVSPHGAPGAAWHAGTSQPSACGDRGSRTTLLVSPALTLALAELSFPASPCHCRLSYCADGVCHIPSMSPHCSLTGPPASSLPVGPSLVLVAVLGLPPLPVPAQQHGTRSSGVSSIPIILLPAAPLLCSQEERGAGEGWPRPRLTSSSSGGTGLKQGDSSCLSLGAAQSLVLASVFSLPVSV